MYQIFQKYNRQRQSNDSANMVGRYDDQLRKRCSTLRKPVRHDQRNDNTSSRIAEHDADEVDEFADDQHIVIDVWPPASVSAEVTWNRSGVTCTATAHSTEPCPPVHSSAHVMESSDDNDYHSQAHHYPVERQPPFSPDARRSYDTRRSPDKRGCLDARWFSDGNARWPSSHGRSSFVPGPRKEPSPAVTRWFPEPPDVRWSQPPHGTLEPPGIRWSQPPPDTLDPPDVRWSQSPHGTLEPPDVRWSQPPHGTLEPPDVRWSQPPHGTLEPPDVRWSQPPHGTLDPPDVRWSQPSPGTLDPPGAPSSSSPLDSQRLVNRDVAPVPPSNFYATRRQTRNFKWKSGGASHADRLRNRVLGRKDGLDAASSSDSDCSSLNRRPLHCRGQRKGNHIDDLGSAPKNEDVDVARPSKVTANIGKKLVHQSNLGCLDSSDSLTFQSSPVTDFRFENQTTRTGNVELHGTGSEELHATGSQELHGTGSEELHGTGSEELHGTGSEELHGTSSEQLHGTSSEQLCGTGSEQNHASVHKGSDVASYVPSQSAVPCQVASTKAKQSARKSTGGGYKRSVDLTVRKFLALTPDRKRITSYALKEPLVVIKKVCTSLPAHVPDAPKSDHSAVANHSKSVPSDCSVVVNHPSASSLPSEGSVVVIPSDHLNEADHPELTVSSDHSVMAEPVPLIVANSCQPLSVPPTVAKPHELLPGSPNVPDLCQSLPGAPVVADVIQLIPYTLGADPQQPVPDASIQATMTIADSQQLESSVGLVGSNLENIVQQLKRKAESQIEDSKLTKKRRWNRMPPCSPLVDPLPPFPTSRSSARLSKLAKNKHSHPSLNEEDNATAAATSFVRETVTSSNVPSFVSELATSNKVSVIQGEYAITHINGPSYMALEDRENWHLQADSLAYDTRYVCHRCHLISGYQHNVFLC